MGGAAAAAGLPINVSAGVGVAGHSMGGQATIFSAAYNGSSHRIQAAAMHHAYTHSYPAIPSVPFLLFTGTHDAVAPPRFAQRQYDASSANPRRGLVNKDGADHHEPSMHYNPFLALASAAWFKVYLDGTPDAPLGPTTAEQLLFGAGGASLCGGGDGRMAKCVMPENATARRREAGRAGGWGRVGGLERAGRPGGFADLRTVPHRDT
mmetsp:Transcript_22367/g.65615  ORF Transcript_22367/g.65615 Transcript_22367/m.65615 type:complete len:208 (-) Transcript_22367:284-907(-)